MKRRQRVAEKPTRPVAPPRPRIWPYGLAALTVLFAMFEVYGPALRGPFLFDDLYLPFTQPEFAEAPLKAWLAGVRPLLMLTFWVNLRISELAPFSYHLFNAVFHLLTGLLVFLVVRKLLGLVEKRGSLREILSVFAGALFLLHPVQTESVAYVASRSETLSALFFYAALALFLYRRSQAISWPSAAGVVILFAAAVTTKEHTAALVAVLLLTDYFWNPGFSLEGTRRNWRLYVPMALGMAVALRFVWQIVSTSDSAGFGIKEFTWYQYFFTQCRAIWTYLRLFLLPYGQTLDYDFPISRSVLEHGAIVGLIGLVALVALAILYRRRYPLASYGWLAFLLILAPTSSVVPLLDPIAERRVYLALPGLLLVCVEFLRRWKIGRGALACLLAVVLIAAAALTRQRNQVWTSATALWQDTVARSSRKVRPHFQLAYAYYLDGRCQEAVRQYATAAALGKPDYRLLVDWGVACDCAGDPEQALEKLWQAAALKQTAQVYSLIGMVYGKQQRRAEALEALDTATRLDPRDDITFVYRGNVYASSHEYEAAAREYRRALALNPRSQPARDGLALLERRLKGSR